MSRAVCWSKANVAILEAACLHNLDGTTSRIREITAAFAIERLTAACAAVCRFCEATPWVRAPKRESVDAEAGAGDLAASRIIDFELQLPYTFPTNYRWPRVVC